MSKGLNWKLPEGKNSITLDIKKIETKEYRRKCKEDLELAKALGMAAWRNWYAMVFRVWAEEAKSEKEREQHLKLMRLMQSGGRVNGSSQIKT